jgi:hypothetical protein
MNTYQKFGLLLLAVILVMSTACSSATPTPATMEGFWSDPDDNVTTVKYQDGQFVAVTTYDLFQSHSQNSLVSSSYVDGALTWKYCPPAKPCITMTTVSFNGDTLDVKWTNDNGESGTMTLKRVAKGTN